MKLSNAAFEFRGQLSFGKRLEPKISGVGLFLQVPLTVGSPVSQFGVTQAIGPMVWQRVPKFVPS